MSGVRKLFYGFLAVCVLLAVVVVSAMVGRESGRAKDNDPGVTPTVTVAKPSTSAYPAASSLPGATMIDRPSNCPTNGKMQELHGMTGTDTQPVFIGVPWDPCQWILQEALGRTFDLKMLSSWQYTARMPDSKVAVFYGDNQVHQVKGATIRFMDAYSKTDPAQTFIWDGCQLLQREDGYGVRQAPSYRTVNGNVKCDSAPTNSAPSAAASSTSAPADDQFKDSHRDCPRTPEAAADKLGAGNWEFGAPNADHKFVKWVGKGLHGVKWPGYGNFDYWKSTTGPVAANISDADSVTFNCIP